MFCGHCGKEVKDGADFCPYCGARLHTVLEIKSQPPERAASNGRNLPVYISVGILAFSLVVLIAAAITFAVAGGTSSAGGYRYSSSSGGGGGNGTGGGSTGGNGGNSYVMPMPPSGGKEKCAVCSGTGVCSVCNGTGQVWGWKQKVTCTSCRGTCRCVYCDEGYVSY